MASTAERRQDGISCKLPFTGIGVVCTVKVASINDGSVLPDFILLFFRWQIMSTEIFAAS